MATTKAKPTAPSSTPATGPPTDLEFKDLRVLEFGVENFMRVRAVVIRPRGANLIELTGKNRQGKTSVLRALVSVFAGKNSLPSKPIRNGETESRVWTVLGKDEKPELTIEEVLTLKDGDEVGRKLVVTPAEGRAPKEPQALLNRLYAPIAFAPFEFSRLEAKKQLEVVKALVPGVDFAALAQRRADLFEERTQVGRERDRAAAKAAGVRVPADAPLEEVDVGDMLAQVTAAAEHNATIDKRRRGREQAAGEAEEKREEVERLQARIRTLNAEATEIEAKLAKAEPLPAPVDVHELTLAIETANNTNANVRTWRAARLQLDEVKVKTGEYDALTRSIADLDDEKALAIEAADLPVPGLELAEDGLLLNGLPFDQASGREKLETAVRIGMAINPDLKLIVAEEGGLLDDEGLDTLESLAAKFGFLVVIEKVTNGETGAFVIEDGGLVP